MIAHHARRKDPLLKEKPTEFGECIMGDHFTVADAGAGVDNERAGLCLLDVASEYSDAFAKKTKGTNDSINAFKAFVGTDSCFYSDNSKELKKMADTLTLPQATSTPYRPQSNGTSEKEVGMVKFGARTLLMQAGVDISFWPFACKFFCWLATSTRRKASLIGTGGTALSSIAKGSHSEPK